MASGTERGGVGSRGTVAEALPAGANGAGSAGAGAPLMVSASGLRGIAGKSLTPDVAARFAGALGTHLRGRLGGGRPTVVVGRDGRAGGQVVHQAALAGLMGAGCDVIDLGVAMTPTVGVMVDELEADGGMVVTASHNPQEWNGLKCLVSDRTGEQGRVGAHAPAAEEAGEIIARYGRGGWAWQGWECAGSVRGERGGPEAHAQGVVAALHGVVGERTGLAGLRDVRGAGGRAGGGALVDSVNASGREGARLLMGALGVPLRHVGDRDTGRFGRPPEPTAENLAGLSAVAAEAGVAVGFAQDPDGDRLAVLDEAGRYIGEEYTLALAAESVLGAMGEAARGAVVVANLSTSRMVEDVAWRHGAVVARAPVGEANVVAEMRAQARAGRRVVLGGEGNGGVIWPEVVLVRDSLGAMALVLALLARTGRTVSELAAGVPRYAIVKRKVELRERAGVAGALARVSAALAGEGAVVDQRDGVWVGRAAERWWVHVRASNTEPIMRLIAEAPTEATARGLLDRAGEALAG